MILLSWGCSSRNGVVDFGDGRYTGDLNKEGQRHGKGLYEWNNGDRYEGTFQNGKRHGKGVFVWNTGDRYEGDYRNGRRHGRGSYVWSTGARYDGQYAFSKREGRGVFTDNDGSRFEGWWQEDKEHGHGILSYPDGRRIEDMWIKGKRKSEIEQGTSTTQKHGSEENATTSPEPETSQPETSPATSSSQSGSTEESPATTHPTPDPVEPIETPTPQPPVAKTEEITGSRWEGTEPQAKVYFESIEKEGNVSALHVKETGAAFEGTITIVRENGEKQGKVTVVNGLLHGEEIVWGEDGKIIERNRYENGKLMEENVSPAVQPN